jgi:NAD(P)-dependent dehydrogenase (short-subunit alcohol dehydrogenase family)
MNGPQKTAVVTGASRGIGAGVLKAFVERGFNVVATARNVIQVRNGCLAGTMKYRRF